jgi:hypothetical protein
MDIRAILLRISMSSPHQKPARNPPISENTLLGTVTEDYKNSLDTSLFQVYFKLIYINPHLE